MLYKTELMQQIGIILLFLWSFINLLYYAFMERSKPNWWYVIAFMAAILYQIYFYVLVFLDRSLIYMTPDGYLTDLSYKRNLLFAVLAVIVSVDMATKARREHKLALYLED